MQLNMQLKINMNSVVLAIKDNDDHHHDNKDIDVYVDHMHDNNNDIKRKDSIIDGCYISGWHLIIFNKQFAERNRNVGSIKKTDEIDIESETFHTGLITKIDHEIRKGFVFNKNWNSHHEFTIYSEFYHKIKVNQLIEFTLRIPKTSYLHNDDQPIKRNDCVADNVNIISKTLILRPKSSSHGFSGLFN